MTPFLLASNLGGFLIGTILGVVGGSLGFAWTPLPPGAAPRGLRRRRGRTTTDDTTIDLVPSAGKDSGPDADDAGDAANGNEAANVTGSAVPPTVIAFTGAEPDRGGLDPSWGAAGPSVSAAGPRRTARYAEAGPGPTYRYSRPASFYRASPSRGTIIGGNLIAILVSLLTFGVINLSPTSSPTQATDPPAAAATRAPIASPDPAVSASPAASTRPSSSPGASAIRSTRTAITASPSPSPTPTGSIPAFALATAQSTLSASSGAMTGFAYDGVVSVPTATGTAQMMQFSASSLDLSRVHLAVSQGGATETTTASSLDFTGNVVLYATKLSGDILGVPATLTPATALATILRLLSQLGLAQSVTQVIPLQMTNVTTQQPYTSADSMTASALQIS